MADFKKEETINPKNEITRGYPVHRMLPNLTVKVPFLAQRPPPEFPTQFLNGIVTPRDSQQGRLGESLLKHQFEGFHR